MANVQKENGYTAIANEILEQLVNRDLLGAEFRILLFIIRKTYGYHKKQDKISLTQFEKGTGLSRPTIVKTLKNLEIRNMIIKFSIEESEGNITQFVFQKDADKWVVNTPLLVKHKGVYGKAGLTENGKAGLTHKRKKDNTKDIAETSSADIILVLDMFQIINPAIKRMYGNTTQRKACRDLIDNIGLERLKKIILETLPKTNTLPFFPTITTPLQLQDKFISLESAIKKYRSDSKLKGVADINKQ